MTKSLSPRLQHLLYIQKEHSPNSVRRAVYNGQLKLLLERVSELSFNHGVYLINPWFIVMFRGNTGFLFFPHIKELHDET